MRSRNIRQYILLDIFTSDITSALAYPETEKDGMYFWFRLLDRFGLVYLCTPQKEIAPDAYFAYRSKLDKHTRERIQEGLKSGQLDPSLLDEGIILGIEFESKASHAKKHFLADGDNHISVICCNENDWSDAPVSVWSLQDYLGILREPKAPQIKASPSSDDDYPLDEDEYKKVRESVKSQRQRLVLMAFLLPGAREVIREGTKEKALELSSHQIKRYANQIAEDNELGERIKDIGGVLTAFTQEGTKRTLGLLHKGEKVDRGRNYYLPVRFIPYIKRIASAAHLGWENITDSN